LPPALFSLSLHDALPISHDSGLCTLPEPLMSAVEQVHLREITQGSEMTFDYKLRGGPVQSGNALRLMRSLGLHVPLEDEPAARALDPSTTELQSRENLVC